MHLHPTLQPPTDSLCNKSKETIFVCTLAVSFSTKLRRTSGPVVETNPLSFSVYHTTKPVKSCSQKLALLFFLCFSCMRAHGCICTSPHPTPTTQTHKQTHCTIKFIKASSCKSWHKYGAHQTGNHMKKSAEKRKKRTTWLTGTTEHACEWAYKTKSSKWSYTSCESIKDWATWSINSLLTINTSD